MPQFVKDISFDGSHMVVTFDSGAPRQFDFTKSLRVAAIPDIAIGSLTLLTSLAQIVMVLVRQLEEYGILDENLVSGFDLQYIHDTLTSDLVAEDID